MKQRSRDAAYLVTANDLFSGQTVYHCGSGWSARLEDAAQLATSEEAADVAARLNVSDAGVIVGAYAMALDQDGHPTANREARRLMGPGEYVRGRPDTADINKNLRGSHVPLSGI